VSSKFLNATCWRGSNTGISFSISDSEKNALQFCYFPVNMESVITGAKVRVGSCSKRKQLFVLFPVFVNT
jgi:hypothetical protein